MFKQSKLNVLRTLKEYCHSESIIQEAKKAKMHLYSQHLSWNHTKRHHKVSESFKWSVQQKFRWTASDDKEFQFISLNMKRFKHKKK